MSSALKNAFEKAAKENYWSDSSSLSGPGSNLVQTRIIREKIPELLQRYEVSSMLDAPCGDLFWMKEIIPRLLEMNVQYRGADIVGSLIDMHNMAFKEFNLKFHNLDITREPVPPVDLIFTRDCFIHLSFGNILSVLKNYQRSGSKYLLLSTYTKSSRRNYDVKGFYLWGRMLNMQKFPFHFPEPLELINEGCTEGKDGEYADKSLGLWKISDLDLLKTEKSIRLSLVISPFFNVLRTGRNLLGGAFRKISRLVK